MTINETNRHSLILEQSANIHKAFTCLEITGQCGHLSYYHFDIGINNTHIKQ